MESDNLLNALDTTNSFVNKGSIFLTGLDVAKKVVEESEDLSNALDTTKSVDNISLSLSNGLESHNCVIDTKIRLSNELECLNKVFDENDSLSNGLDKIFKVVNENEVNGNEVNEVKSFKLNGFKLSSAGSLMRAHTEIQQMIENLGGLYSVKIDKSINAVISNTHAVEKMTYKIKQAQINNIIIISERFLEEITGIETVSELLIKHII